MAKNFHIDLHRTTETLHMKLMGDFDGSSASELINVLEDNQDKYFHIFINTSELNTIHPFGKEVLRSRISNFRYRGSIVKFIGKNIGASVN